MIAYLKGRAIFKGGNFIIVLCGEVGYKVFILSRQLVNINQDDAVEFFTYHYVREDEMRLYGFSNRKELDLFELLLSVSGIGPKSAQGILEIAPVETIISAIRNGDKAVLTKVSGIGRKTAERVILELQSKAASLDMSDKKSSTSQKYAELLDALTGMGYSVLEARSAIEKIPKDADDLGQALKIALKELGSR